MRVIECRTRNCKTENFESHFTQQEGRTKSKGQNQRVTETYATIVHTFYVLSSATSINVRPVESTRYKSRGGEKKNKRGQIERPGNQHDEDLQDTPERMSKICDIQNSHRWNNQNKSKRAANFST